MPTPNLGLPQLAADQAQKHVTVNEALLGLDALVQLAVLDRSLAAPPGSPAEGARYIVAASPTGAWAGHANHIAFWLDGAWRFFIPGVGWLAWVVDEAALLAWNGSAWVDALSAVSAIQNLALLGIRTTADATIRQYAARRGLEIVRTYADEGKSGLRLDGRDALKRLIEDVQSGNADFTTILVYDISRWGRFQDADESAYYEYICKRTGISVQYCAEQFENDGSPVSTIVKGVKRAMAGEYSRELSVKVFAGQCRLIELGFRQGGPPGYGLRRSLIDQSGTAKGELARGEHKSIQTDRVVLVPGPPDEVENVRWIYRAFVNESKPEIEIADILNRRGVMTDLGRPWTRGTVHQILINEKYIGNNVWNRGSFKLKKKRVRNSPEMWVRADSAFEPLVNRSSYEAAQAIISERSQKLTNEEMLESLQRLLHEHGYLSGLIIDEADKLPSTTKPVK